MTDPRDICRPGRRMTWGLVGGTKVETEAGWRRVEHLVPGTRIHTLDGGLQTLRSSQRLAYGADLPMVYPEGLTLIPGGALGNCEDLYVLPEQCLMFSGAAVESLAGVARVLVLGADLPGHGTISLAMPVDGIEVFQLCFDEEEVVFANTGMLMHCPPRDGASMRPSEFKVLGRRGADLLMSCRFLDRDGDTPARKRKSATAAA